MQPLESTSVATYYRQVALIKTVNALRIRDRRQIFSYLRDETSNEATFLPFFGLTLGEFSIAQVITSENKRNSNAS